MSISKAGAGLISSGLGMLGQVIGLGAQRRAEKRQRDHELKMYNLQKKDAIDFWEMENLYNAPEKQMERLKNAGLNPNLVYGSGATATGGSIDRPDMKVSDQAGNTVPYATALGGSVGSMINQIYDLKLKDAQESLLRAQEKTEIQNEALRMFQALNETIANEKGNIDLSYYKKEKKILFQQLKTSFRQGLLNLEKTRADTENAKRSAELSGSRKEGQDIQNKMDKQQLDMYQNIGLPPQLIDQILKTAPFLAPLFQFMSKTNTNTKKK